MEEQENLKNKLINHVIYNIIGFSAIFIVFGIFVFIMVKDITYSSVNKALYESQVEISNMSSEQINFMLDPDFFIYNETEWLQSNIKKYQNRFFSRKVINPNVDIIIRDKNGKITNSDDLGRLEEYASEIGFNAKILNKIYEISLGEHYTYRALNFIYDESETAENKYIQLLINVDSERMLVNSYFKIISVAVLVGLILSIIASYILSKKTLNPLRENLQKQMEFVQNVSHELRTPLTIIQAKQELLLQEPEEKIIDKSEDIILTLNETKRLTKLVKDLMMLTRADSNTISLQKENVNIDEFIKEIVNPYSEIAELQNKEIILNLESNIDVEIDSSKIYQLIIILLDNAIKYTESGDKIEIKTYKKDNKCVIEVADTGIGVSDEGLKRIFERFYREDKARNRETGGSGLGLSIANLIVTTHGGSIKASHNNPKGTIFTIKLPNN